VSAIFFPSPSAKLKRAALRRIDELKLVGDQKAEVDLQITAAEREGWRLYSRAFSLDDGHSATLRRGRAE